MSDYLSKLQAVWKEKVVREARQEQLLELYHKSYISEENFKIALSTLIGEGIFNFLSATARGQRQRYQVRDQRTGKVVHKNVRKFDVDRIMSKLEIEFPSRYCVEAAQDPQQIKPTQRPNYANYR